MSRQTPSRTFAISDELYEEMNKAIKHGLYHDKTEIVRTGIRMALDNKKD